VEPEVSVIDFSIGTTLVVGGRVVPGVNTRRASTTVELKQGQTLAIAGLLQLNLDADTNRIPGVGDLPIIGTLFGNTSSERTEKELLVLVTPYLIAPVDEQDVAPLPGHEVHDPTDLELYLMGRIEGRTGTEFRATTAWDRTHPVADKRLFESRYSCGPVGYSK
jgi:pilus assembly protein CpaC